MSKDQARLALGQGSPVWFAFARHAIDLGTIQHGQVHRHRGPADLGDGEDWNWTGPVTL